MVVSVVSQGDRLIAEAEQEYRETQKPGHAERLADYRRFRGFLLSIDITDFRHHA
jgi:hypothetical protein